MSKIARYLQEHIQGEVSTNAATLRALSTDAGVLEVIPEVVVYPRVTNDIRKVARFAWQLAEKKHILPITARGAGSDQTGAAIGKGVILSLPSHMNEILEFDSRQRLIRVQPGLNARALDTALRLQGMTIPALPVSADYSTIGGAVANNASGPLSGRYGAMDSWVHQIELVLANGDILQTQRVSKRDLDKKKGMQTFEGEIYRSIDNLIEDNKKLIEDKLGSDVRDNVGYASIANVKQKDGSFDLTPLIVGSQGTLGVVSELIMKADFVSAQTGAVVAAFTSRDAARDALDKLRTMNPASLDYYDGELFEVAAAQGKSYPLCQSLDAQVGALIAMSFDDFNEKVRARRIKKVRKLLTGVECRIDSADGAAAKELLTVREVTAYALSPAEKDMTAPALFDGAYVPRMRYEDFRTSVAELGAKYAVTLPLHSRALEDIHYLRPSLQLKKVGDKQKVFKLIDEYADLVEKLGGHLVAESGEGRIKGRFAYKHLDADVTALFAKVRAVFDPHGFMNPEVKQDNELRTLVSQLRSSTAPLPSGDYARYN